MRALLLSCALLLVLALWASPTPAVAHVRLLRDSRFAPRNAASPKVDGAYSVAGPCGGESKYGKNGVAEVTEGETVTIVVAYNGGHQSADNAFHAALYCGTYAVGAAFDDSVFKVAPADQPVKLTTTPHLLPLTNGQALVPATDSLTSGYSLTFKLPTLPAGSGRDCVISLLDQRNWGGCTDVKLNAAGAAPSPAPSASNSTAPKSPCQTYCAAMESNCVGANAQYASADQCLTACAAFPTLASSERDTYQCRMQHASATGGVRADNCRKASANSTAGACVDAPSDPPAEASPCSLYCDGVTARCSGSRFFSSRAACMQSCAQLLPDAIGFDEPTPVGNNLPCRLSALQRGACSEANPVATGACAQSNPLLLANDTLSGVYSTSAFNLCRTRDAAAEHTIAGCCCLDGWVRLIHVRGSAVATLELNLTRHSGEMCDAGRVAVLPPGANATTNYTFDAAVNGALLTQVRLTQTSAESSDVAGSAVIGGDRFHLELVDGLLQLTNDVPSTSKPRVCSMQASMVSRIDSTGMPKPSDGGDGGAAAALSATTGLMLPAIMAILFLLA